MDTVLSCGIGIMKTDSAVPEIRPCQDVVAISGTVCAPCSNPMVQQPNQCSSMVRGISRGFRIMKIWPLVPYKILRPLVPSWSPFIIRGQVHILTPELKMFLGLQQSTQESTSQSLMEKIRIRGIERIKRRSRKNSDECNMYMGRAYMINLGSIIIHVDKMGAHLTFIDKHHNNSLVDTVELYLRRIYYHVPRRFSTMTNLLYE